jgi:hypothetical protein
MVLIQTSGTYIHHDGSFFLNIGQIRVLILSLIPFPQGPVVTQCVIPVGMRKLEQLPKTHMALLTLY